MVVRSCRGTQSFVCRYGGGPAIPRTVIEEGRNKLKRVEVYPLSLKVVNTNEAGRINPSSQIEVLASKQAIVGEFKRMIAEKMELKESLDKIRLRCHFENKSVILKHEDKSLEDSKVMDRQTIVLEVKLKDGNWPQRGKKILDKKGFKQQAESGKDALIGAWRSVEYFIMGKPQPKRAVGTLHTHSPSSSLILYMTHFITTSIAHRPYVHKDEKAPKSYKKGLCGLANLGTPTSPSLTHTHTHTLSFSHSTLFFPSF